MITTSRAVRIVGATTAVVPASLKNPRSNERLLSESHTYQRTQMNPNPLLRLLPFSSSSSGRLGGSDHHALSDATGEVGAVGAPEEAHPLRHLYFGL